jgi:prevent-host-death family protein
MKVYTYSEARQKLSMLLDEVRADGEVAIKKRNGQTFILRPMHEKSSPLDVEGVDLDVSLGELNQAVRESRERG